MPKIALIGAGSVVFARRLTIDILSWPELAAGTIALMDIDTESLNVMGQLAQRMVREQRLPTQIEVTEDRRQALDGADYVITSIDVGGRELRERDVAIPQQYGIYQTVADTIGPGGVFRALRTTPVLVDIARDMEALCPQALLLNYTNPMNINMWAIGEATSIAAVGLCHSVQGTAGQLARYMGLPYDGLAYWVAGINHQAWFLAAAPRHLSGRGPVSAAAGEAGGRCGLCPGPRAFRGAAALRVFCHRVEPAHVRVHALVPAHRRATRPLRSGRPRRGAARRWRQQGSRGARR